jgi:hypothetical protein
MHASPAAAIVNGRTMLAQRRVSSAGEMPRNTAISLGFDLPFTCAQVPHSEHRKNRRGAPGASH